MPSRYNPLLAMLWMLGCIASFALMAVAGRSVQAEMNAFELMAWRSAVSFVIVAAILWWRGFAQVRTPVPWLHVKRNLFHFSGQILWFSALMLIPLGQLVALEFTNPIFVVLLAPLMLGERLTARKLVAVGMGFAGVLAVARPDAAPLGWGHLAGLAAALCFALNTIYTRKQMAYDTALCVMFWMTLSQTVMGAAMGAPGGIPLPSAAILPWVIVLGVTGLSGHFALTMALYHAPATVISPMNFLRLPVMVGLGAALYAEPLEAGVFIGGALILAANAVNLNSARRGRPGAS